MVVSSVVHWVRLRYLQYRVTLPLVMLTPMEELLVTVSILLLFGMVGFAAFIYLPDHLVTMTRRATFYFFGHDHAATLAGPGSFAWHGADKVEL